MQQIGAALDEQEQQRLRAEADAAEEAPEGEKVDKVPPLSPA